MSHPEQITLPKAIGDKLYERRKAAALDLEQVIKRLAAAGDTQRIRLTIDKLISEYAVSPQPNCRKGALLCLAAAVVGLGEPTEAQLQQIVPPMLASFTDQDSSVRYYACEALYNVAKVARETFIMFFNDVFDAMFRLCADAESNVQNAVQYLDNLVKDIVTASPHAFNLDTFVPKLRKCLRAVHPHQRQFLISWITVLDSVPDLDMLAYLPQLLDGLMSMLSDPNREIRVVAHKAMQEFLIEIQATHTVDYGSMAVVLVEKSLSSDEFTRLTAIKWLKEFVEMAAGKLVEKYPLILGAVLSNISHTSPEIQQVSHDTNNALLKLQPEDRGGGQVDSGAILATITRELSGEQEPTRLEALRWIHFLLLRSQAKVLENLPVLLPALHDALQAPSEAVVLEALSVLAAIAACPHQFQPVLLSLLGRFRGAPGQLLLRRGGALVLRRLCSHLGAQRVFIELAGVLVNEADLEFASVVVQALNLVLLTSPEVQELRELLRQAHTQTEGAQLFKALYPCWSHSVGALLSLCFLAQAYSHARSIVLALADLPIGAEVLVQADRLVQLLETPCFTLLRLQMLEPRRYPDLLRALYALLALLPQSNAFRTLNMRLQSIPTLALLQLNDQSAEAASSSNGSGGAAWADFDHLLATFALQHRRHAKAEVDLKEAQILDGHAVPSSYSRPTTGIVAAALGPDASRAPPAPRISDGQIVGFSSEPSFVTDQRGKNGLSALLQDRLPGS